MLPSELTDRAQRIIELYTAKGLRIACAESCTGGLIAACLTEISGSSAVLERGFVTYSNQSKNEELSVPSALIEKHGAVSEEVALAMAQGVREKAKVDVGIAVTGIAGPTGGSAEKPVGLVYIAASFSDKTDARRFVFEGDRIEIRRRAVVKALSMLVAIGNDAL